MKRWLAVACALGVVALAVVAAVLLSRGNESNPVPVAKPPPGEAAPAAVKTVTENCDTRSEAGFGAEYTSRRNLVVGPLAIIDAGTFTPPSVVRRVHGNKFPLLVKAGHTVKIEVAAAARGFAALGYGPLPQGEITLEVAHPSVTFIACARGEPSGSTAGGPVTFWSGGLVANEPHCVPLDVYVDERDTPQRVFVELGARCTIT